MNNRTQISRRLWRACVAGGALVLALLLALSAAQSALAAAAADLDQCRNGTFDTPQQCTGDGNGSFGWVNGNAGASNSHYREGESIPYRMRFSGLSSGEHTVYIEYDTTESGRHSLDYLTTYNRTETDADPCSSVTGCDSPMTYPIPADPNIPGTVTQVAGNFTCFDCTIIYVSGYTRTGTYDGTSQTRIAIVFTTAVSNPVLSWGGHIASQSDWGNAMSATGISGSSYHMRLIDLDGSGGSQDRSLKADAVIGLAISTRRSGPTSGTFNTLPAVVSDTVYLTGTNSTEVIAGNVQFYLCSSALGSVVLPPCGLGTGTTVGSPVAVTPSGIALATAHSMDLTFGGGPRAFCFRAEFAPAAGSHYPPAWESNTVANGPAAECFILDTPTAVTLDKFEAFSTGGWAWAPLAGALGALALAFVAAFAYLRRR